MTDARGQPGPERPVIARRLVARGRVQGVFFRASARDVARRRGLTGWVRNRADGAVEIWVEGDPDGVEAVEAWVRAGGPPTAQVHDVEVAGADPAGHARFDVRG